MTVSSGVLCYSCVDGPKLIVSVDEELARFYRAMIPRSVRIQQQRWPAHITVIRNEPKVDRVRCSLYDGEVVEFEYGDVVNDATYYWLTVQCRRLTFIRNDLGLPDSSEWSRPPNGDECFHITLGNLKAGSGC